MPVNRSSGGALRQFQRYCLHFITQSAALMSNGITAYKQRVKMNPEERPRPIINLSLFLLIIIQPVLFVPSEQAISTNMAESLVEN